MGSIEKIKSYSLALTVSVPPKDKDKHKIVQKTTKTVKTVAPAVDAKEGAESGDKVVKETKKKVVDVKDEGKGTNLHKALYIPELDKIALVEERSDTIQFMNARSGERGCKDLDCG